MAPSASSVTHELRRHWKLSVLNKAMMEDGGLRILSEEARQQRVERRCRQLGRNGETNKFIALNALRVLKVAEDEGRFKKWNRDTL